MPIGRRKFSTSRLVFYEALTGFYRQGEKAGLEACSERALRRVWQSTRFSWWMTTLLHQIPDAGPFRERINASEIEYLLSSPQAQAVLAENYVGLPF